MTRTQHGFTLVELVVGMALMMGVFAVLLSLQGSVIHTSSAEQSRAMRLGVITDMTGYLGDRIKNAALVPDNQPLPDGGTCQRTGAAGRLPCLSLVVPHLDASGKVDRWNLLFFQYLDPSQVTTDETPLPGLAGLTYALKEVQVNGTCGIVQPDLSTLTGCFAGPVSNSWLTDSLALVQGAPAFEYDPDQHLVTMRVRSVSIQNGVVDYLPPTGSYSVQGFARNVPPNL